MGKRGPAAQPTALRLVRDNPGKKRINDNEPKPCQVSAPRAPAHLTAAQKKVWRRVCKTMPDGVLTVADLGALERYCVTWIRWREAEDFLAERDPFYHLKDDNGNVKCVVQWPQVSIARNLSTQLLRIEQEFGMTPASRTSLVAQPKQKMTFTEELRARAKRRTTQAS